MKKAANEIESGQKPFMPFADGSLPANLSFEDTQWSVVRAAGQGSGPATAQALEHVCRVYWYPLYVYVRRRGHEPEAAKDLTQAFFERLLQKGFLAQADEHRGRFRSFLLGCLRHFLDDEFDRTRAQKRGGGQILVSLDAEAGEVLYQTQFLTRQGCHANLADSGSASPEEIFDRGWAMMVLERAQTRLKQEFVSGGKGELYEALCAHLQEGAAHGSYADTAKRLGLTEEAIKSAAYRLRRRYQKLIREEVAPTIAEPAELDDEVRYLIRLAGRS